MSNTNKATVNADYESLYDYLENRYGAAVAQDLIDQIKKVDDESYIPDFMDVKMLSEVLEDIKPDWVGYYALINQCFYVLYNRAMASYELPVYTPFKQHTPERMAA